MENIQQPEGKEKVIKKILIICSILILTIVICIILFMVNRLNEDEKKALEIIRKFESSFLKYPSTAKYDIILMSKSSKSDKVLKIKFKAKNANGEYVEDYVFLSARGNKVERDGIETQLGYEIIQEDKSEKYALLYKINEDNTPYKSLNGGNTMSDFLGAHYMGNAAKKDIIEYNITGKLDEDFIYINTNKINKKLKSAREYEYLN